LPLGEWDRCRPWIEAALGYDNGGHTVEDVQAKVASGLMQFWPAPRGCIITEILQFPRRKMVNVYLAGGELDQLADMQDAIIAWAKENGCTGAMLSGRKGWERVFSQYGWKHTHSVLMRDFDEVAP
jgi:hypothetical protein